jgi:hypothetical protein
MSQLIGAASNYEEVLFDVRIPSLTDTANIVEAFKAYHFGLDNSQGDVEPAANSIHSWLKDFDERIETVEASTTITLAGTANEISVSGSVGNITVSLPDDVTIGRDLTVTRDLFVSDDLQVSDNLTVLGTAIFSSTASAMSTLRVNGATTLDSTLGVGSNLSVSGSASIPTLSATTASITTDYVTTSNITTGNITTANITGGTIIDTVVKGLEENIEIVSSAATGTIDLNIADSSILYYTSNASANHTLNIRYDGSNTLNSKLAVGDAVTVTWINTNGATPYYPTVYQVDGSSVTPLWQNGIAPTFGNASSTDAYTLTIIKTAATPTYVVLASQIQFKA